jgi:hypothetical protein
MKYVYGLLLSGIFIASLQGGASAQMGMPGHAPPVPMTPAQFAHAAAGDQVQIAVRVGRIDRSTIYAELLQHETDAVSRATGQQVVVFFPDGTPTIMGQAQDVTAGAVLFVYGVLTKPGHVDAKRVVIDTKYVTVR